ncbi:MAG: DNA polymerase I, partial [Gammaproteobacteria bacterium]|nr:DNA polymerase I [Gammaproteobacteria bacterium]
MTQSSPLILVDGSSYLFRAFYALPDLRTARGQPTGAMRGVISMLQKLCDDYPESSVVVVFDAPGKTFRDEIYGEYKATRAAMPDDLRSQIGPLHELIQVMGLPLLVVPDVEADDVIGTLAKQASEKKIDTIISTSDKDLAQLVNEHVTLMDTMKNEFLNPDGVVAKFGVRPDQIIDYLALMGDKVDNIPGVEKCGPKTAVKWLDAYGSLEGVVENADQVKGKIGENLRSAIPQLPLSYELATIKCDVELEHSLEELTRSSFKEEELIQKFEHYEFHSLLERFFSNRTTEVESTEAEITIVRDASSLEDMIHALEEAESFAFATFGAPDVAGVSISCTPTEAYYLPIAHEGLEGQPAIEVEKVLEAVSALLNSSKSKILHDVKATRHALRKLGLEITGPIHDVMLEAYVIHSSARGGLNLRSLAAQ